MFRRIHPPTAPTPTTENQQESPSHPPPSVMSESSSPDTKTFHTPPQQPPAPPSSSSPTLTTGSSSGDIFQTPPQQPPAPAPPSSTTSTPTLIYPSPSSTSTTSSTSLSLNPTPSRLAGLALYPQHLFPSPLNTIPSPTPLSRPLPYAFTFSTLDPDITAFFHTREDALENAVWNFGARLPCLWCQFLDEREGGFVEGKEDDEGRRKNGGSAAWRCDFSERVEENGGLDGADGTGRECSRCVAIGKGKECVECIEVRWDGTFRAEVEQEGGATIWSEEEIRAKADEVREMDEGLGGKSGRKTIWSEEEVRAREEGIVEWRPIHGEADEVRRSVVMMVEEEREILRRKRGFVSQKWGRFKGDDWVAGSWGSPPRKPLSGVVAIQHLERRAIEERSKTRAIEKESKPQILENVRSWVAKWDKEDEFIREQEERRVIVIKQRACIRERELERLSSEDPIKRKVDEDTQAHITRLKLEWESKLEELKKKWLDTINQAMLSYRDDPKWIWYDNKAGLESTYDISKPEYQEKVLRQVWRFLDTAARAEGEARHSNSLASETLDEDVQHWIRVLVPRFCRMTGLMSRGDSSEEEGGLQLPPQPTLPFGSPHKAGARRRKDLDIDRV